MADTKIRLDKAVSVLTGLTRADSRKAILKGQVWVDGALIAKPDEKLYLNGKTLNICGVEYEYRDKVYIMMNKPEDCVCTDISDQKSVLNLLPKSLWRRDLFTVGRLDKDTTGLLLITNDGEYAHSIISPKKHIEKRYLAVLSDELDKNAANRLSGGIALKNGDECKALNIEYLNGNFKQAVITVDSGKYHQVKRMFAAVGNNVVSLKRLSIGGMELENDIEQGKAVVISKEQANSVFVQSQQ